MATGDLKVHLVGSVPLEDTEKVFHTLAKSVGKYMPRIPDGETGSRRLWVAHMSKIIKEHPALELDTDEPNMVMKLWDGRVFRDHQQYRFRKDVNPAEARFETHYADLAIESFETFKRLQHTGEIAADARFMVAIPSPVAVAYNYISKPDRWKFIEIMGDQLLEEVQKIAATLPPEKIALQWDVLQEILVWEDYFPDRIADYKERIWSTLAKLGNGVPKPVQVGYHYCYGSPQDEHLIQPKDTSVMVEITQGLLPRLNRPLNFLHMPVPKDRTDAAYYAPLAGLKLPAETELYLGLVHSGDDAGNEARLKQAAAVTRVDGVATECGWGRKDPDSVPPLLDAHMHLCAH